MCGTWWHCAALHWWNWFPCFTGVTDGAEGRSCKWNRGKKKFDFGYNPWVSESCCYVAPLGSYLVFNMNTFMSPLFSLNLQLLPVTPYEMKLLAVLLLLWIIIFFCFGKKYEVQDMKYCCPLLERQQLLSETDSCWPAETQELHGQFSRVLYFG